MLAKRIRVDIWEGAGITSFFFEGGITSLVGKQIQTLLHFGRVVNFATFRGMLEKFRCKKAKISPKFQNLMNRQKFHVESSKQSPKKFHEVSVLLLLLPLNKSLKQSPQVLKAKSSLRFYTKRSGLRLWECLLFHWFAFATHICWRNQYVVLCNSRNLA